MHKISEFAYLHSSIREKCHNLSAHHLGPIVIFSRRWAAEVKESLKLLLHDSINRHLFMVQLIIILLGSQ